MKKIISETVKMAVALLLGMVCMWFVLSFAWSLDEMSVAEKAAGVVYFILMMPLYEGIKRVLRLR